MFDLKSLLDKYRHLSQLQESYRHLIQLDEQSGPELKTLLSRVESRMAALEASFSALMTKVQLAYKG